jgi:hypothetical protein
VPYYPREGKSKVTGTVRGTARTVKDMRRVLASITPAPAPAQAQAQAQAPIPTPSQAPAQAAATSQAPAPALTAQVAS